MPVVLLIGFSLLGAHAALVTDADPADRAQRRYQDACARMDASLARMQRYIDRFPALEACYAVAPDMAALDACREPGHESAEREEKELRLSLVAAYGDAKSLWTTAQYTRASAPDSPGVAQGLDAIRDVEDFGRRFKTRQDAAQLALWQDDTRYAQAAYRIRCKDRRRLWGPLAGFAALAAGLGFFWYRRKKSGHLRPGDVVGGDYRIERDLGRGGHGVVFEATDLTLKRQVVLRRIHKRLHDVAESAAALKHPNIVQVYSVLREGGRDYLAFERDDGRPLAEHIAAHGRLPLAQAQSVVRQVAAALAHAHERGVVHGDLKPERIMVHADGTVKVMDFGITRPGGASKAADIRALGACACGLLAGAKKAGFEAFKGRALSTEPGKGFRSAMELAEAFDSLAA